MGTPARHPHSHWSTFQDRRALGYWHLASFYLKPSSPFWEMNRSSAVLCGLRSVATAFCFIADSKSRREHPHSKQSLNSEVIPKKKLDRMCINHRKMMIISVIEWFSPAARDREREKDQRRGPDKSRSSAASPVIFSHKSFRTGRETKRQRWWKIHHRWADKRDAALTLWTLTGWVAFMYSRGLPRHVGYK